MPYFAWKGINLSGSIKRGKSFARDPQELERVLLEREIALLQSKESFSLSSWIPVPSTIKINFFHQLSRLLKAGILLPQALRLIAAQTDHIRFQEAVHALSDAVYAGRSFSQSLSRHGAFFTPLMVHMCRIGEESGTLIYACHILYEYMQIMNRFKQALRKALLMPLVTTVVFLVVVIVILVCIVPRFVTLFSTMNAPLPALTRLLIALSSALQGWTLLVGGAIVLLIITLVKMFTKTTRGKLYNDHMVLYLPSINCVIRDAVRMHFTRALGSLVQAGFSVPHALPFATSTIPNTVLSMHAQHFQNAIHNGDSLSRAMTCHAEQWFDQQAIAMIIVGEESGNLAHALIMVADYYQHRVEQRLQWYALCMQPLLIIILGLIIALFVCAIYMPLFSLAQVM